ncbi:hypothetical protein [Limisalsivibrio acetivorans]|uniref:hypothetical protein n=1 Tax=Limisalsivibrio acetivorans TaxID=1304888 RepID=UPI0003B38A9C|nr:hypothetical protein [Limisalsivibrio acetivorans]
MRIGIFTAAGGKTGFGHLGRCLALRDALRERGEDPVVYVDGTYGAGCGIKAEQWQEDTPPSGFDICVIDSYEPDALYLKGLDNGLDVFLDDYMRLEYPPGVVINGALYAEELPYNRDDTLLGVEYALLRKPFWDLTPMEGEQGIFVSAGGSTPGNVLEKICRVLLEQTDETLNVLSVKPPVSSVRVNTFFDLDAEEMLKLMQISSCAFSAAGQTTYELARAGLTGCIFSVAENQENNLRAWERSGVFKSAGRAYDEGFEGLLRKHAAVLGRGVNTSARELVDGQGARRAAEFILERVR